MSIVSVPVAAHSTGETPETLAAGVGHFAVSRDGSTLVFGRLTGKTAGEPVLKKLATGEEKVFAAHDLLGASVGSLWPQMAPDGTQVIYRLIGEHAGNYLLRVDTGEISKIASIEQFQLPCDWSADGKRVLGECPPPRNGICELDVSSGSVRTLLVDAKDQLLYPSWSWDGHAFVFMRRQTNGQSAIWIAPAVSGGAPGPEETWVRISPPNTDNYRPRFSSDGNTVYYLLGRGGQLWLVAQKIDRNDYQPLGEPAPLSHVPVQLPGLSFNGPFPLIAVTPNRVYFSVKTVRGNLWISPLY